MKLIIARRPPHSAITHLAHLDQPESHAISIGRWRYIHRAGGHEERHGIETDPHEWIRLASKELTTMPVAKKNRKTYARSNP